MADAERREQRLTKVVCGHCQKVFASSYSLKRHQRVVHDNCGKYLCEQPNCGFRTMCHVRFTDHQNKHCDASDAVTFKLNDCSSFPPPMSHVQGIPRDTWEAITASVDADLLLYALARRRTYNVRAVDSQSVETFYSCMSKVAGTTDGVPCAASVGSCMAKAAGSYLVRSDSKGWNTRWSKGAYIPESTLEKELGTLPPAMAAPVYIKELRIQDHYFDTKARASRARPKPRGISDLHSVARGCSGVRRYHVLNEATAPHVRANIGDGEL